MLGIIIGVGAVMTIITIGDGARKQIVDTLGGLGADIMLINSSETSFYSSNPMTIQDAENMQNQIPYIKSATSVLTWGGVNTTTAQESTACLVFGAFPSIFETMNLELAYGRAIENEDDFRNVAVIGYNVANKLFQSENPLGKQITLHFTTNKGSIKLSFDVIGVLKKTGTRIAFNVDEMIIIPNRFADYRVFNYRGRTRQILATSIDENSSDLALAGVDLYLFNKFKDTKYYSIMSQSAMLEAINQIVGIINVILVGIAAISLVVGGIGIMNIMLVTVKERTREIGIKMAIGATRQRILLEFLVESIILTVVAGLIGIMLGGFLSTLIAYFGRAFGLSTLITWKSIILSFGISVAIGLFFGIYPANQASKLSPVEALRYE